jgi:hypothetical protein
MALVLGSYEVGDLRGVRWLATAFNHQAATLEAQNRGP